LTRAEVSIKEISIKALKHGEKCLGTKRNCLLSFDLQLLHREFQLQLAKKTTFLCNPDLASK